MLIVQQIAGLILAGFSVFFMLWFLTNTVRESLSRYRRHSRRLVPEAASSPVRTFSPQAPSNSARVPHNPDIAARRPLPQFGQSSRSLHTASR
jgi:hypothetical protein